MGKEFDTVENIMNILKTDGSISTAKCIDYRNDESTHGTKSTLCKRAFKTIEKMYSINHKNLFDQTIIKYKKVKGRGSNTLTFVAQGYRNFLNNNRDAFIRDFTLRYQYCKSKEDIIKKTLLSLIVSNIEDALVSMNEYSHIEKEEKVQIINEAIFNNKKISLRTSNKKELLVSPIKIFNNAGYWYLVSHIDKNYTMIIKINNIVKIAIDKDDCYDEIEDYRKLDFDPWGSEKSEKNCKIRLKLLNENIYNYFKIKKFKINQKTDSDGSKYFVEFEFNNYYEVAPIILSWMDYIEIEDIDCKESEHAVKFVQELHDRLNNFISKHREYFLNS